MFISELLCFLLHGHKIDLHQLFGCKRGHIKWHSLCRDFYEAHSHVQAIVGIMSIRLDYKVVGSDFDAILWWLNSNLIIVGTEYGLMVVYSHSSL